MNICAIVRKAMVNLNCLKELLGDDEFAEFMETYNKLPTQTNELLRLIAAGALGSLGSTSETGVVISTENANVAGATNLPSIPSDAKAVMVTAYDDDLLFTLDGVPPTPVTPVGHFLPQGSTIKINSDLSNVVFAPATTSGKIYVTYVK